MEKREREGERERDGACVCFKEKYNVCFPSVSSA